MEVSPKSKENSTLEANPEIERTGPIASIALDETSTSSDTKPDEITKLKLSSDLAIKKTAPFPASARKKEQNSVSEIANALEIEDAWGIHLLPKNEFNQNTSLVNLSDLPSRKSFDRQLRSISTNLLTEPLSTAPISSVAVTGSTFTTNTFALLPSIMSKLSSSSDVDTEFKKISGPEKKAGLRVGMFGSTDFNEILTPPDSKDFRYETTTRYALGYSGGISLGFEKGRWEVETGAIYSSKSYSPPSILYIFGSVKEGGYTGVGLKYFELDIVQVPLNFKYHFVYKDKWRLYLMGGSSLSVVNYAHYHSADQEDIDFFKVRPLPTPSVSPNASPSEIIKQVKDFEDGWLEGGSFWENSYFTLNAGVGIERYFSTKTSLFFQPTYQRNFNLLPGIVTNEIGPNKDRFSTMSFHLGVRVRVTN